MGIDKDINEFLCTEELSESLKPIYENVLRVFSGYFRENNCDLSKFTYIDIFKSLDYYISERKIKFENTAVFYISAVKEFIIYCIHNTNVKNSELMSSFGYGSYNGGFEDKVDTKIESLINAKIIKREKSGIEIDSEDFKRLINECDKIIDNFEIKDLKANINNGKYMDYIAALGIKIICYTGIKVGLLISMELNNLSTDRGYLVISDLVK